MYPISFLFIIVIDYVMRKAMDQPEYRIKWQRNRQLTDLDLADDIAMMAENDVVCQEMTTRLQEKSAQVGLRISQEKTKITRTNHTPQNQPIVLGQNNLECVERFTYLGSVISSEMEMLKQT